MINSGAGSEDGRAPGGKGDADQAGAREHDRGFSLRRNADDAAAPFERCGDVEVSGDIDGDALGTSQAAIVDRGAAVGVDTVNAIVAGGGGAGDEEPSVWAEGHVVGGYARLERGENKGLAIARDLED